MKPKLVLAVLVQLLVMALVLAQRMFRNVSANARYAMSVAALLMLPACLPVTFALVEVPRFGTPGGQDPPGDHRLTAVAPLEASRFRLERVLEPAADVDAKGGCHDFHFSFYIK